MDESKRAHMAEAEHVEPMTALTAHTPNPDLPQTVQPFGNRQPRQVREFEQAACWVAIGFFGMLRRSELAALSVGDVGVLEGGDVEVTIRRSKTGQQGQGARVYLAALSGSGIPIGQIVQRQLAAASRGGAGEGEPLFPRDALWRRGRGARVEKAYFTKELRAWLAAMQQDVPGLAINLQKISEHSLRRGGATAAANAGVSIDDIKEHGRWRSNEVLVYVRRSAAIRRAVVARM